MKRSEKSEAVPSLGRRVLSCDLPIISDWQMDFLANLFGQVIDLEKLVVANDNLSEV